IVIEPGRWYAGVSDGKIEAQAEFSSNTPPFDEWSHLVAVVDRQAARLRAYLNGELADDKPIDNVGKIDIDSLENFLDISRPGTSEVYVGHVGEMRIYPRAISEAQISIEYTNATRRDIVTIGPAEVAP